MTGDRVRQIALSVLEAFRDNSSFRDYRAADGWTEREYEGMLAALRAPPATRLYEFLWDDRDDGPQGQAVVADDMGEALRLFAGEWLHRFNEPGDAMRVLREPRRRGSAERYHLDGGGGIDRDEWAPSRLGSTAGSRRSTRR